MSNVLIDNLQQLRGLPCNHHCSESMRVEYVQRILELTDAGWLHSGAATQPHAELTSGMCSDGYINMTKALAEPNVCEMLGHQAVLTFRRVCPDLKVDWVIGSSYASITASFVVARELGARHGFTEKMPDGSQAWKRHEIKPGEIVLQIEDLVSTLKTLTAVRVGIRATTPHEVKFAPAPVALVHRSDIYEIEGDPIAHVAHFDINKWDPEVCPLCKAGSKPLRPKENWQALKAS